MRNLTVLNGMVSGGEVPSAACPPVFTKIAHVCLYVSNLERSINFYTKLGFKKRFVFTRKEKLFGAYLEFGEGNFIELFEDPQGEYGRGRLAHFCLEALDIDAAIQFLTNAGVEFTPKKKGCDETWQIWLKDPDGNDFEVHQYTPGSSQLTGGDVEADW
ncbi:MAG: VOC family protein [Chitinispirillia bacterium]|nr:VOC family protein [Chitinispirillia bacterium]MCL2268034.1 VOC family protein [Chitinispirillia bacterium]